MTTPNKTLGKQLAMKIGVDNVVVVKLNFDSGSDDVKTSGLIYDSTTSAGQTDENIYSLPGVQTLNINPNSSIETAYYDDGPGEVACANGNIEVSFTKAYLNEEEKSFLLGKAIIKDNVKNDRRILNGAIDLAPWVALGFKTLRSDGKERYVWLYKGKFSEPADNNETKGESINFQSNEIVGRFVRTDTEFIVPLTSKDLDGSDPSTPDPSRTSDPINPIKIEWDEDNSFNYGTTSEEIQKHVSQIKLDWFKRVIKPNDTFDTVSIETRDSLLLELEKDTDVDKKVQIDNDNQNEV